MRVRTLVLSVIVPIVASAGAGGVGCGATSAPPQLTAPVATPSRIEGVVATSSCAPHQTARPVPISPGRGDRVVVARAGDRTLAYVANEDDGAIHTVDVDAGREIAVTPLEGSPSSLVALADGRVVATIRDRNALLVLEPPAEPSNPLAFLCRRDVPAEPVGLAAIAATASTPERIAVTSGFGRALTLVDARDLSVHRTIAMPRDPRAIAVHRDRLFVSHVSSARVSVVDGETGTVAPIDLLGNAVAPPAGAQQREKRDGEDDVIRGGQSYALAADPAGRIFAPMVAVDPGEPKPTSAYGGPGARPILPFVGVLDAVAMERLRISPPGNVSESRVCTLPRAAALGQGNTLWVACLGIDEVFALDPRAANAASVIRRRVAVAPGPMGLAVAGDRVVVMSQFAHEVGIFSSARDAALVRVPLSRPETVADATFERGRRIFHDAFDVRISTDGRACASCHPDGLDDGNTWSTPDGPRQTIALAGRVRASGPYGWFGQHGTLREHLGHTMHRLGGQGFTARDEADLAALEAYLVGMKVPSRDAGLDRARVAAGEALFHDARQGCGRCHAGGGSDGAIHEVGSGTYQEAQLGFDTPSLQLVGATAPYFHDGRYATLEALVAGGKDRMGHVSHLDDDARASLVAYMKSLAPPVEAPLDVDRRFAVASPLAPHEPSRSPSPFARSVVAQNRVRPLSEVIALDVATLPTVAVAPNPAWDDRRADVQDGVVAEGRFDREGACFGIDGHASAWVELGWFSTATKRTRERCVGAPYPDGVRHWAPTQAWTLDPIADGGVHVVLDRGHFRHGDQKTVTTQRIESDAVPVFEGLGYAFRVTCDACQPTERDRVFLVSAGRGFHMDPLFSVESIPIEPGGSLAIETAAPPWRLDAFAGALGRTLRTESQPQRPRGWTLRLDVTRGRLDAKPTVIVSRSVCTSDDRSDC